VPSAWAAWLSTGGAVTPHFSEAGPAILTINKC
jgi:hypothetical protein